MIKRMMTKFLRRSGQKVIKRAGKEVLEQVVTNKPVFKSKINLKEIITLIVGILIALGFIPEEYKETAYQIILVISPLLGVIFRTWFTEVKLTWSDQK